MSALDDLGITRDDIIDRAVEKILDKLQDDKSPFYRDVICKVRDKLIADADKKIDSLLETTLSGIVDAPFNPVDEFGEPNRKEPTTLREMVKVKALKYLDEPVNSDGKATSYNTVGSRLLWTAIKAGKEIVDTEMRRSLDQAVAVGREQVKKSVAEYLASAMTR